MPHPNEPDPNLSNSPRPAPGPTSLPVLVMDSTARVLPSEHGALCPEDVTACVPAIMLPLNCLTCDPADVRCEVEHAATQQARAVVVHSGWRDDPEDDRPLWTPTPRDRFRDVAAEVRSVAREYGMGCVLRPHAHGVVSDLKSLESFLRSSAGTGWRVLLDPAVLTTGAMREDAPDHLSRLLATPRLLDLLGAPATCWLAVSGTGEEYATLGPAGLRPLEAGEAWSEAFAQAWARSACAEMRVPLVVASDNARETLRVLGGGAS